MQIFRVSSTADRKGNDEIISESTSKPPLFRLLALFCFIVGSFALAQEYSQSPFLADRDVPPVAERLPENPVVIEPFEGYANYGGTLRYGIGGTSPGWGGLWYLAGWENLVFWTPDYEDVRPNIAERWEVSDDAREYTFYLREGMKWSDGEPLHRERHPVLHRRRGDE